MPPVRGGKSLVTSNVGGTRSTLVQAPGARSWCARHGRGTRVRDRAAADCGAGRRPFPGSGRGLLEAPGATEGAARHRLVLHDVAGLRSVDHLSAACVDADVAHGRVVEDEVAG